MTEQGPVRDQAEHYQVGTMYIKKTIWRPHIPLRTKRTNDYPLGKNVGPADRVVICPGTHRYQEGDYADKVGNRQTR
jgi:hypothetical protein